MTNEQYEIDKKLILCKKCDGANYHYICSSTGKRYKSRESAYFDTYKSNDAWYGDLEKEAPSLSKNKWGDIYSDNDQKYTINPLTDEKVPVYCDEEQKLIEKLRQIEDDIIEIEDWQAKGGAGGYGIKADSQERKWAKEDISNLEKARDKIEQEIDKGRNGGWKKLKDKQKKLAEAKEKKLKAKEKKKKAAEIKEEKRQAKLLKERQKAIDEMPDELKDVMDDLFS